MRQVPDKVILEHNVGCSLSMLTETTSSLEKLEEQYKSSVGVDFEASGGAYSGSFSADSEWSGYAESLAEESTETITSSADCIVRQRRQK